MTKTLSFDINSLTYTKNIVIATQGSRFKNAIKTNIIKHFLQDSVYIKIIDVDRLH